jgi:hypothetical protein
MLAQELLHPYVRNKRILARIQLTPDHIGDSFSKRKLLASFPCLV